MRGAPETFCKRLLSALGVEVVLSEEDRRRIPKTGAVVVLANHPFGIVEGVALAQLLPQIRPDVKIMANRLLGEFSEIADRIICVDPFGGPEARRSNARGMREAMTPLVVGSVTFWPVTGDPPASFSGTAS